MNCLAMARQAGHSHAGRVERRRPPSKGTDQKSKGIVRLERRSQLVQVARIEWKPDELEIEEELILVIDEVLEISEQQRQDRLAFTHEGCWNLLGKLVIS